MSSFFTLPASQRKRKRADQPRGPATKKRGVARGAESGSRTKKASERDESISGSDSEDEDARPGADESVSEEASESEEGETAAERRLKLAERYLENVREEVDEVGFDAADVDRDLIAERLKEDADESKGRRYRLIASTLSFSTATHTFFRADTQSTTSIVVHPPHIYTSSKDSTLIKWKLPTPPSSQNPNAPLPRRKAPKQLSHLKDKSRTTHNGAILSIAISPCGTYLATGGRDKKLTIFSAATMKPLKSFTSHRDSVTSLSFAPQPPSSLLSSQSITQPQLLSSSLDRTLKTYSLPPPSASNPGSQIAYVETLFGHQDSIPAVAAMGTDHCVSVGARDRTARYWKVVDETQLVFRGGGFASKDSSYHEGSIDVVAAIPPHQFVTGGDAGTLSLWSIHRKKPVHSIAVAHGLDDQVNTSSEKEPKFAGRSPRWITALAVLQGTDLVVSGSWDGFVRAWKVSDDKKRLEDLGIVGSISEDDDGTVTNGAGKAEEGERMDAVADDHQDSEKGPKHIVRGVINDLAVFERLSQQQQSSSPSKPPPTRNSKLQRKKQRQAEGNGAPAPRKPKSLGITIAAAVGKEHRLGRWKKYQHPGAKNGAVILDVDFRVDASVEEAVNGTVEG